MDVRRTHSQGFSGRFQKVHTEFNYDCTLCAPLHGRYEVSLAVATPWRLQLCVVLVSAASKQPAFYCNILCNTQKNALHYYYGGSKDYQREMLLVPFQL